MGSVDRKNLTAAAMLMGLSELRSAMGRQQPYKEDLALVRRIAGNDPALQKSLDRLAPYAERGVLSRETLQKEFRGLAGDIVMAKLQGEDLSVKEKMMQRMAKFVKLRRIDDIEGETVDARVARAQKMIDTGDIRGAIVELQKLEGAPRAAADPWMDEARGSVIAQDASDALSHTIVQALSAPEMSAEMGMPSAEGVEGFSIDTLLNSLRSNFEGGLSDAVSEIAPDLTDLPGNDVPFPAQ